MKNKIFLLICLVILSNNITYASDDYVSPETYAVNESELTDYMTIPSNKEEYIKRKKVKEYSEKEPKKIKEGIKGWLREKRYNAQESHHGEIHEIKVKQRMEYEQKLLDEEQKKEE